MRTKKKFPNKCELDIIVENLINEREFQTFHIKQDYYRHSGIKFDGNFIESHMYEVVQGDINVFIGNKQIFVDFEIENGGLIGNEQKEFQLVIYKKLIRYFVRKLIEYELIQTETYL